MTPDDITKAVKLGVKEAHDELYIDARQHYDDHTSWQTVRRRVGKILTGALYALGSAIIAFFVYVAKGIFPAGPPGP